MPLNLDTLGEIMLHLNRRDAIQMSRTCHNLQNVSPRAVLREEVVIRSISKFVSFCSYMSRNPSRRSHCLRRLYLSLSGYDDTPDLGELVAWMFRLSTELVSLRLANCNMLELDERVSCALAQLTKLRRLKFYCSSVQDCHLLKTIQAPLTAIEVSSRHLEEAVDPNPVFARFSDTLEDLNVKYATFRSADVRYPRLVRLRAGLCQYPELRPIVISFPNIRGLTLHTEYYAGNGFEDWEIEDRRQFNLIQADSLSLVLDRLEGTITNLYILAPRGKVGHLNVGMSCLETLDYSTRLTTLLSDLHPSRLDIQLSLPGFDISLLGNVLAPAADSLAWVVIRLNVTGNEWEDPSPRIVSSEQRRLRRVR